MLAKQTGNRGVEGENKKDDPLGIGALGSTWPLVSGLGSSSLTLAPPGASSLTWAPPVPSSLAWAPLGPSSLTWAPLGPSSILTGQRPQELSWSARLLWSQEERLHPRTCFQPTNLFTRTEMQLYFTQEKCLLID